MAPLTLFEKIWKKHVVHEENGKPSLLYIDLHLVHEVTSPQAFEGLRQAGRKVRRKDKTFTIVASRSHMSSETETYVQEMKEKNGEVLLMSKGSSLKLCMVAEGNADCYPRFAPTMEWDTAAGQAICENAGFKVIDWETKKPMLYNRKKLLNNWFLVK